MTNARFSNKEGTRLITVSKGHLTKVADFKNYFLLNKSFPAFPSDRVEIFCCSNE